MIVLAVLAFLLLLALTATQLKLRALGEAHGAEQTRADAQRAQFERDTQALKRECDSASAASAAVAARWRGLYSSATTLVGAETDESWARVAELFASAGHFRAVSVRVRDGDLHSFVLRHAVGVGPEALARLRDSRVPEPVLKEWMDPRNAFGCGFVLRARPAKDAPLAQPGAALGPQDAWFLPFEGPDGRVSVYLSLGQPDPCRLPLAEELPIYDAAAAMVRAILGRQIAETQELHELDDQMRLVQLHAAAIDALRTALGKVAERLRTGLGHVEGYAQSIADFGGDMPREEERRLAAVIVSQAQDMCEEALMVRDLAELAGFDRNITHPPAEFTGLYADSLQFLSHRAENRGVVLSGPPLQGGICLNHPPGMLKRLLVLVSNELLAGCERGHEIAVTAWLDQEQVHIHWRASGAGLPEPGPREDRLPGWIVAQAMAQALGGTLMESTPDTDSRAVSLAIPVGRRDSTSELRAA
ncbi:MAG: HAMP domain-containing histidine kinase [Candidatus Eisenbacteria bacterium]|nr:HAMP domain-containing histidine kinase [Candidatus Eisenbacteria bacterium]